MAKEKTANKNEEVFLEKLTINMCIGNDKEKMRKGEIFFKMIVPDRKPVKTCAKKRIAKWQIRPGLPIGYKLTLRREKAIEFLKWILESKGNNLNKKSIDNNGNFSIGIVEYLNLKGIKYNPEVGIIGFEVMATFSKKGYRIKTRKLNQTKIPQKHKVKKEEAINFLKSNMGVNIV